MKIHKHCLNPTIGTLVINADVTFAINGNNVVNITYVTNATKFDNVANVTIFANKTIVIDMAVNENTNDIIDYFKGKDSFTKEDLRVFIKDAGISIRDEALRIRIHRLKKKGIIQSIARGKYTIANKHSFTLESDKFIKKINRLFLQKYDDIDYCIWNTRCLNNFMIHQPISAFYVLETDKDITESTFYYLKDNNVKVFNNPTEQIMEQYVMGELDVVVVKPLVSRAPLIKVGQIVFPELEKILVDIFCDNHQFYIYGGQEMINIFENAFHHYNINYSSLYAYAARRGKKDLIKSFIKENVLDE